MVLFKINKVVVDFVFVYLDDVDDCIIMYQWICALSVISAFKHIWEWFRLKQRLVKKLCGKVVVVIVSDLIKSMTIILYLYACVIINNFHSFHKFVLTSLKSGIAPNLFMKLFASFCFGKFYQHYLPMCIRNWKRDFMDFPFRSASIIWWCLPSAFVTSNGFNWYYK